MRISSKLLLIVSLPTVALCVVAFLVTAYAEDALRNNISRSRQEKARSIMDEIDRELHMRIAEWQAVGRSEVVRAALRSSNRQFEKIPDVTAYMDEEDRRWLLQRQTATASSVLAELLARELSVDLRSRLEAHSDGFAHPIYREAFVTNRFGANVGMSHVTTDYRQDDESWWQEAMHRGVYISDFGFDESAGVYSIDLCLRIDDATGAPQGVTKVVLNLRGQIEMLDRRFAETEPQIGQRILLVTRDGRLIAAAGESGESLRPVDSLLHGIDFSEMPLTTAMLRTDASTGVAWMTTVAQSRGFIQNPGAPWAVVIDDKASVLNAPAERIHTLAVAVTIIVGGASVILCAIVAHFTVLRVRRIVTAVARISDGVFDVRIEDRGHDELASLARDVNGMSESLQQRTRQLEETNRRLEASNLELHTLANQLKDSHEQLQEQAVVLQATQTSLECQNVTLAMQNVELDQQRHALVDAMENAEEASKAKSAFLANMSHEIRTPMTAILGFADMLAGHLLDGEQSKQAVSTIQRNGQHLLSIINDILDLSKVEAGKLEIERITMRPAEILADVRQLLKERAKERGLELFVQYDGLIPATILSDPTRIKQALVNLVGNAIKFTESGSVKITADCDREAQRLIFRIIDTGIGIDGDQVKRIFAPFAQADVSTVRRSGGTGLGLTITRHIAQLLGGDVTVESEPGAGSTFSFFVATGSLDTTRMLSSMDGLKADNSFVAALDEQPAELDGRILVVEDGADNQRLIAFILEKAGAEVVTAENGRIGLDTALAAWRDGNPFDLVLMDVQMPVMDGLEATRKLRDAGYLGQIVALTAHAMHNEIQKCLVAGCNAHLSKPIKRPEFLSEVAYRVRLGKDQPVPV